MAPTEQLFAAIRGGDAQAVVDLLDRHADLAAASQAGVSVLRAAVYAGHADLVPVLRSRGACPDVHDAAALGDVERLRELLDADPDLTTTRSGDGFTALHLAAFFGHPRAAELLLARGADPEAVATNETLLQPLHSAAAGGHEVIAHLLLDRGADIDAVQTGGYTPLHAAAANGDVGMAALLLGRGADPALLTDDGRSAVDLTDDPSIRAMLP